MTPNDTGADPASPRLLVTMLALALLGVASLMLAPFERLAPPGIDPTMFKWLSLVQPTVIALAAVVAGHFLAHRVGLDVPLLRAVLHRQGVASLLAAQLRYGLPAGLAAGLVLTGYAAFAANLLPAPLELPLATRLLYGGVTEEFVARWGAMSMGVWLAVRLSQGSGRPRPTHFWIGNGLAAALFALAHLPALLAIAGSTPGALVMAAMAANFLPALLFGWLFQVRGLEAAMIAHATAHLVAAAYAFFA